MTNDASAGPRVSDGELAELVREARIFNEVFKPADVTMHDASKQPVAVWFQPEQNREAIDTDHGYYGYHEWGDFVEDSALPMIEPVALDLADCRTALAAANARIAVLEAERDRYKSLLFDYAHDHAEQIMEIAGGSQPLPPDKSWDVWCHALAVRHLDIDIITGDPEDERIATASPGTGTAHE